MIPNVFVRLPLEMQQCSGTFIHPPNVGYHGAVFMI